jgi:beta-alanine--pyruvate transaminase
VRNVIDIRNIGLMGAVELAPRPGAPGARAYEAHVKAFFEEDLLVRYTGDIVALSPPLIVSREQIDRIAAGLRSVLERID